MTNIREKVADCLVRAGSTFREDQKEAYRKAIADESNNQSCWVMQQVLDNAIVAEERRSIESCRCPGTVVEELKGGIDDLGFAGPLALDALDPDHCAGDELLGVCLGAGELIEEVSAVGIRAVDGDLVLPPGLMIHDEALNGDFAVKISSGILSVCHDAI